MSRTLLLTLSRLAGEEYRPIGPSRAAELLEQLRLARHRPDPADVLQLDADAWALAAAPLPTRELERLQLRDARRAPPPPRAPRQPPPAPRRRVLEAFRDWRGEVVRLECGHILQAQRKGSNLPQWRACQPCKDTGRGGEVQALHDIRCGCAPCMGRE